MNPPERRILTIKDASAYLGRSPWTVAEMVRTGKIAYIKDGKRKLLDINDINEWIMKNKRTDSD